MQPEAELALQTRAGCAALQVQDALTRNLARQYGPQSVRVIGVNPAWVKTEAITALASVLQVWWPLKHHAQIERPAGASPRLVHALVHDLAPLLQ